MNNNKTLKIIITAIILLIILTILVVMYFTKKKNVTEDKNIIYEIYFYDGAIPGTNRDIKIYEDKVKIDITYACSAVDCKPTTEEITQNFSKENINKLKKFVKTNFSTKLNGNKVTIDGIMNNGVRQLTWYQSDVIYSLESGESSFEQCVEEYKYKIVYTESENTYYIIYFKDNKSILVKKISNNNIDTYKINFSEKNLDKLNNYIKEKVESDYPVLTRYSRSYISSGDWYEKSYVASEKETYIINSIIENNESILNNLDNL